MLQRFLNGRSVTDAMVSLLPLALFGIGALFVFKRVIQPPPPNHMTISTGHPKGEYADYAKLYQDDLKTEGVNLKIEASQGAVENFEKLSDEDSPIDVGFVLDGLGSTEKAPSVSSLGSIYYAPVWVFYRGQEITRFSQFVGKRISIGKDGSDVQQLALPLLNESEITDANTKLMRLGWRETLTSLKNGSIDAAFFLASAEDDTVQRLLKDPELKLMSLDQADAITKRIPFLHHLKLPHGTIDLKRNLPPRDTDLVATTVTLLIKDSLHPALVYLLLQTITRIHSDPGFFEKKNEFPIDKDFQFPLADEAKTFYKSGPPFWQKHLPFWVATLFDRFLFLSLPLLILLFPILKMIPQVYRWRVERRIYKKYGALKLLEAQMKGDPERKKRDEYLSKLNEIEVQVNEMNLPLQYSNHYYSLRGHIEFVRSRMKGPA